MFKKLLTKINQIFQTEDVLFAYRNEVGLVDARGIEKYLNKRQLEHIYLFTESEINELVREYLERFPEVKIIKTDNIKKAMNDMEKELIDKKIRRVDLDNFGIRPIQHDAC